MVSAGVGRMSAPGSDVIAGRLPGISFCTAEVQLSTPSRTDVCAALMALSTCSWVVTVRDLISVAIGHTPCCGSGFANYTMQEIGMSRPKGSRGGDGRTCEDRDGRHSDGRGRRGRLRRVVDGLMMDRPL